MFCKGVFRPAAENGGLKLEQPSQANVARTMWSGVQLGACVHSILESSFVAGQRLKAHSLSMCVGLQGTERRRLGIVGSRVVQLEGGHVVPSRGFEYVNLQQ